ncbi:MAG: polymorphic toxin-type HINT domain-containing protein [Pirellulales bacterium]
MPLIVEGTLTIGRELGLAYLTAGGSTLTTGARLALRTALTAREVYQGSVNFAIAYDKLNAGDKWGAGWHALLGTINFVGAGFGAKGIADDAGKLSRPYFQASKVGNQINAAAQSVPATAAKRGEWCFPKNTPVSAAEGLTPIQNVRISDRVWAFDFVRGEWRLAEVIATHSFEFQDELTQLTIAGEQIETTPRHPVWIVSGENLEQRPGRYEIQATQSETPSSGRWVDAGDLQIGDVVFLRSGEKAAISAIKSRPGPTVVYNLTVADLHCYAVGVGEVLVHNDCFDDVNFNELAGNTLVKKVTLNGKPYVLHGDVSIGDGGKILNLDNVSLFPSKNLKQLLGAERVQGPGVGALKRLVDKFKTHAASQGFESLNISGQFNSTFSPTPFRWAFDLLK